jgi:hypothetical protein
MQGKKTHEQQLRILERKPDMPDGNRDEAAAGEHVHIPASGERQSEFPVSRAGVHQESVHNKHNHSGQAGHKPQQHGPDESPFGE